MSLCLICSAPSSSIGVLRYGLQSSIPANLSSLPLPRLFKESELISLAFNKRYQTLLPEEKMPLGTVGRPDLEIILVTGQEYTREGRGIRWLANNGTFDMLRLKSLNRSLLLDLYHGNEENLPHDVVYTLGHNQLVDIIVQNTVALNGVCESHPMHMHGHKFWIHSYGVGSYRSASNIWPDMNDPVLRDSLMVYASSYPYFSPQRDPENHRKPCGWTKLRLIANNPGLWMFHCHIGAHASMGMNVLLKEGIDRLSTVDMGAAN